MLIKIPEAPVAFANSRNSARVTNLPEFLYAGFLGKSLKTVAI